MAIKFERVQAGDELWQKTRGRMGNTTIRVDRWFRVRVIEVAARTALVSWNGNRPETWPRYRIERLYRSRPPSAVRP